MKELVPFIRDKGLVSVINTQESGTYAQGELIDTLRGDGFDGVLHGDPGDLTNAIRWGTPEKWQKVASGKFQLPGPHHNWATYVILKHMLGFEVCFSNSHFHHGNDAVAVEWRAKQAAAFVAGSLKAAAGRQLVMAGDFNIGIKSKDTVTPVFEKAGFVWAATLAEKKDRVEYGTFNDLGAAVIGGSKFDRVWVIKGTRVLYYGHLPVPKGTSDHDLVVAQIEFVY